MTTNGQPNRPRKLVVGIDFSEMSEQALQRRAQTEGKELWCQRHSERHPRAHVYHFDGPSADAARPWGFDAS